MIFKKPVAMGLTVMCEHHSAAAYYGYWLLGLLGLLNNVDRVSKNTPTPARKGPPRGCARTRSQGLVLPLTSATCHKNNFKLKRRVLFYIWYCEMSNFSNSSKKLLLVLSIMVGLTRMRGGGDKDPLCGPLTSSTFDWNSDWIFVE